MTNVHSKEQISRSIQQELEDAIRNVGVLLEFLGKAPDQQLKSQFDGGNNSKNLSIAPPCKFYDEFLNRLTAIRILYQETGKVEAKDLYGDPKLSDRAFILWSQDFLAALAAPATVDSIQLTDSFLTHRFNGHSPAPASEASRFESYAKDMVGKMNRQYWMTLVVTIITMLISIYALSGHQIVDQRKQATAELSAISSKIADLESHMTNPTIVKRSAIEYVKSVEQSQTSGASLVAEIAPAVANASSGSGITTVASTTQSSNAKSNAEPIGKLYLCDNVEVITDGKAATQDEESPSFGPYPNRSIYYYSSYDGIDACNQRSQAMLRLFSIGEQLMSWQRFATLPLSLINIWYSVPEEMSHNAPLCQSYAGFDAKSAVPKICEVYISEISEYFGSTAESILGCISLYIMPCLYGFLGASVATFRYLRRQVDKSYLNFTDRSVFIQNGILGIVAGIVVGLFVSSFSSGTGTATALGLSAIAFLSGYNVSGLFSFFDEVSARIFRVEGQPAK
jgi:hypothetical protein